MVTVILRGGLGNQMFQYAAGLDLALKNKTGLLLDLTYLNDRFPRSQFTRRVYDLDIFAIDTQFTTLSNISSSLPLPGVWLGLDFLSAAVRRVFGGEQHTTLWGFYQGEHYFNDNAGAVRDAFRFKYPLRGEAVPLAKKIRQKNSVSLHIRRGDYTLPKYKKMYGATDLAYYERALKHIAERKGTGDMNLFIFSDDIAWCREHVSFPFPTTYVDGASSGPKESFHLELMSLCDNNIIANSSFSWWAAWLNQNSEKIIVAPERWKVDGSGKDIVPASWTRL